LGTFDRATVDGHQNITRFSRFDHAFAMGCDPGQVEGLPSPDRVSSTAAWLVIWPTFEPPEHENISALEDLQRPLSSFFISGFSNQL
jgi:hypothetical protein